MLLLLCAALVLAIALALRERQADRQSAPSLAAAVRWFTASRNRMTPEQVRLLFGPPTEVYRDNPRALCWRYRADGTWAEMCWGPKRRSAWIASNVDLRR